VSGRASSFPLTRAGFGPWIGLGRISSVDSSGGARPLIPIAPRPRGTGEAAESSGRTHAGAHACEVGRRSRGRAGGADAVGQASWEAAAARHAPGFAAAIGLASRPCSDSSYSSSPSGPPSANLRQGRAGPAPTDPTAGQGRCRKKVLHRRRRCSDLHRRAAPEDEIPYAALGRRTTG
jgi:hypothetical protein